MSGNEENRNARGGGADDRPPPDDTAADGRPSPGDTAAAGRPSPNDTAADDRPPPSDNVADRRLLPDRAARFNRTLLLCALAMLAGYLLSGRTARWLSGGGPADRKFETMATYGRVSVPPGSGAEDPGAAAEAAEKAIARVNDLMSPFGPSSDIRRLNEAPAGEWVAVSPQTWTVVMEALRWHRLSGGAFDPTIGPIKRLFVFEQQEAAAWPDESALAEARARSGADKLLYEREGMKLAWAVDGMRLDLGAIAKGYGADCAAEALLARGAENALVDIGGELRLLGGKPDGAGGEVSPWSAGIRNPRGDGTLERLELVNAAVATSGDYERYFTYKGGRYEHIIDPRTGLPLKEGPDSVASVTVIHPDSCLAADALATTLSVLGVEEGRAFLKGQSLGLFSKGIRVIMYSVEGDGLRRVEFNIDQSGSLTEEEEVLPGS